MPEAVVRRRFDAGWRNFQEIYRNMVNEWALYDASGNFPIVIEEGWK